MTTSSRFRARISAITLLLLLAVALGATADEQTRSLLRNTLLLVVGTCGVSLPLGTALALLIAKTDVPGRRLVALLLGALLLIPLYLQAAAWDAGFGIQGWYTLVYRGPPLLIGWRGSIWIHAMAAVPWVVLIVAAGLRHVESELEEQALLDGTAGQVMWHVTLRRAAGAIGCAALWIAVTVAGEMTVTDLFQIRTFAEEVYTQINLGGWIDQLPANRWTGTLLCAVLTLAGVMACAQLAPTAEDVTMRRPWRLPLRAMRWPSAAIVMLGLVLVVGLPLGNLVYQAGLTVTQADAGRLRYWSLEKTLRIVSASPMMHERELRWSLVIAACSATAAVVVAIPLAWRARKGPIASLPALAVAAMCLAIPGPLLGIGLIWLLNRPDAASLLYLYDRTILAPWLAQTLRALPLAILIVWHALASVPEETLDSAQVDGAGWIRLMVSIALPMRVAAIGLAWLVSFAVALGELAATLLVYPPGMTTLAVRIFGLLHYGVDDQVAGICLALVAAMCVLATAAWFAASSLSRRETAGD